MVCHETAHLIHFDLRKGVLNPKKDVWQLYAEGFAVRVSQLLYREGIYHQDQNGWLDFYRDNLGNLKKGYLDCLERG